MSARIQSNKACGADSCAFTNPVTLNNLLIVAFYTAGGTFSSISDTLGNDYEVVSHQNVGTFQMYIFAARCKATGANTVSITMSVVGSPDDMLIMEASGANPNVDAINHAVASGTSFTLNAPITISDANAFLFGFFGAGNGDAGWTFNGDYDETDFCNEGGQAYQAATSTGTYDPAVTGGDAVTTQFGLINVAFQSGSIGTLEVTTTALHTGAVNTPYTAQLEASGGVTPYTWSISSGTLPAGLSLNSSTGVISGTPTGVDTATLIFEVTDSIGENAFSNAITLYIVGSFIVVQPSQRQLVKPCYEKLQQFKYTIQFPFANPTGPAGQITSLPNLNGIFPDVTELLAQINLTAGLNVHLECVQGLIIEWTSNAAENLLVIDVGDGAPIVLQSNDDNICVVYARLPVECPTTQTINVYLLSPNYPNIIDVVKLTVVNYPVEPLVTVNGQNWT